MGVNNELAPATVWRQDVNKLAKMVCVCGDVCVGGGGGGGGEGE
jgi:hypothetical protein